MRILVVDDSSTMRAIERRILEGLGQVQVVEAGDGVHALASLGDGAGFSLAVIDWNMPGMDGLALVRRIRQSDQSLPLVLVTTEAEKSRAVGLIRSGVNGYLVKPFTPDDLMQVARRALSGVKAAA